MSKTIRTNASYEIPREDMMKIAFQIIWCWLRGSKVGVLSCASCEATIGDEILTATTAEKTT